MSSLSLAGVQPMYADGATISSLRVSKSGNVTGASCISNFASIYRTNLDDMAARHVEATAERVSARASAQSSRAETLDTRPPFTLYGNPGGPLTGGSPGAGGTTEGVPPRARTPGSETIAGDAPHIRADRERYGASRDRVTDRKEDWRAAEPKQGTGGSPSPFELRKRAVVESAREGKGEGEGGSVSPFTTGPPRFGGCDIRAHSKSPSRNAGSGRE